MAKFTSITKIEELKTDQRCKVCGKGSIDNKGKKPSKAKCADMVYKTPTKCLEDLKGKAPDAFIPETGTFCLYYKGENNACQGDFYGENSQMKLKFSKVNIDRTQDLFTLTPLMIRKR